MQSEVLDRYASKFVYIHIHAYARGESCARAYTCVDGPTRIRDINGNGFVLPMRADSGEVDLG